MFTRYLPNASRPFHRSATASAFVLILIMLFALAVGTQRRAEAVTGPRIVVYVDDDIISGEVWMVGSVAHITVVRRPTRPIVVYDKSISVGTSGSFSVFTGGQIDILPGDTVTVTDGVDTKVLVVSGIWATDSDEAADTVSGMASPNSKVATWIPFAPPGTAEGATADARGRWTVDYSADWSLWGSSEIGMKEYDSDGDATRTSAALPVDPDVDHDGVLNTADNCPHWKNATQYDGDGDGVGTLCDDVDRVWGPNRYATAAAVSKMAFSDADTVFIALGTNFPDALVAAAAGGYEGAPVLLTTKRTLPPETIAEIRRIRPVTAYIVGGTAVISPAVGRQVQSLVPTVKRLAGANRYETAVAVADEFFSGVTRVMVASGENFPDALVGASPAGHFGIPLLLTRSDHVPAATLAELERSNPSRIYVIGGPAAISATAVGELARYGPVVRLSGANRYETAAAVDDEFYIGDRAFLAFGGDFPDALVAGAAAGYNGGPVLLVEHDSIPAATRRALDDSVKVIGTVVGGTAVIGGDVFDALP